MADPADLAVVVSRFAARLRAAGLGVGPERSARFAAAIAVADPQATSDPYWCALATLVADPSEIGTFDRVFRLVFESLAEDHEETRGERTSPPLPDSEETTPDGVPGRGSDPSIAIGQ